MTLREKQSLFASFVARLIRFAESQGYEITLGEAHRTRATAKANAASGKGIANSLHCLKLAIDLNLFKDGKYLAKSEDHASLGRFWKSLDPLCRWGGDFRRRDGNHYSLTHGGRS